MSDRLKRQIEIELSQLRLLFDEHRSLIKECTGREPTTIERSALAAMLHSFYCGLENIFKRITLEQDGVRPGGDAWHREKESFDGRQRRK